MSSYGFLAGCYDQFTTDVDYAAWGDYIQRHFQKNAFTGSIILDLACGTGSLTWELARRGYEMIGADRSPDMLAQAAAKDPEGCETAPIFLCQPMEQLDLYGTIDACVCCLDSVNYMTRPAALARAFRRVHTFLMPGGVLLFDINTPEKLRGLDGQVFLDEREDAYVVWRAEFSPRRSLCTYGQDLFTLEADGRWSRREEVHEEYAYEPAQLEELLEQAGFRQIRQYGALKLRSPQPGEQRIFFAARKEL